MSGASDKPRIQATGRGSAFEDVFDEMTAPKQRGNAEQPPTRGPEQPAQEPEAPAAAAAPAPASRQASPARKRAAKAAPSWAAASPARREPYKPAAPAGAGVDLPQHVTRAEATVPLQVKIPVTLHWQLKQAAAWTHRSGGMTRAVSALVTLYTHDPELVDRLIDEAESEGQTLGAWLHDVLLAAAGEQQ